jgi:exodeoxyribonuclease VII small subunit
MSEPTESEPSFEASTERLAHVVEELERGDLPLERALALFEEGVKLARTAQTRLDRAERRVEELLGVDARGQPITRAVAGYPAPRRDGASEPDDGAEGDER